MPFSVQSGVSLVGGFHCTARRIQVGIDNYPLLDAGTRTERNETLGVCGRVDTGFSLLFNFNTLKPGWHRLTLYADGALFEQTTFQVAHFGAEFLTGLQGKVILGNFPTPGSSVVLRWDEEKQNFSIAEVFSSAGGPNIYAGTYYGALREQVTNGFSCGPVPPYAGPARLASFTTAIVGNTLTLDVAFADGGICRASGPIDPGHRATLVPIWGDNSGTLKARFYESSCRDLLGVVAFLESEHLALADGYGTADFPVTCANRTGKAIR
jgi:hypothetical protein